MDPNQIRLEFTGDRVDAQGMCRNCGTTILDSEPYESSVGIHAHAERLRRRMNMWIKGPHQSRCPNPNIRKTSEKDYYEFGHHLSKEFLERKGYEEKVEEKKAENRLVRIMEENEKKARLNPGLLDPGGNPIATA